MTKAVSKTDICFIKAMLLGREDGPLSLNFASNGNGI